MCGSGQFILALFCEFVSLRVFDVRRGKKKFFLANFAKKKKLIRGSPKKNKIDQWKSKKKNSDRENPDHAPPQMINGRPLNGQF